DGAEEGHPPLPGGEDPPGLAEVGAEVGLDDVVEAAPEEAADEGGGEDGPGGVLVQADRAGVGQGHPQAGDDAHHVEQAVPAQGDGPGVDDDRIDVDDEHGGGGRSLSLSLSLVMSRCRALALPLPQPYGSRADPALRGASQAGRVKMLCCTLAPG